MRKTGSETESATRSIDKPRYVTQITNSDVLLGRGSLKNSHPGNITYRDLVKSRKVEYIAATQHQPKKKIAQAIIDQISTASGRFLREVRTSAEANTLGIKHGTQAWVLASDSEIHAKVKQALREGENKPREGKYESTNIHGENDVTESSLSSSMRENQEQMISEEAARHSASRENLNMRDDSYASPLTSLPLVGNGVARPDSLTSSLFTSTPQLSRLFQQPRLPMPVSNFPQPNISFNDRILLNQLLLSSNNIGSGTASNQISVIQSALEQAIGNANLRQALSSQNNSPLDIQSLLSGVTYADILQSQLSSSSQQQQQTHGNNSVTNVMNSIRYPPSSFPQNILPLASISERTTENRSVPNNGIIRSSSNINDSVENNIKQESRKLKSLNDDET